MFTMFRLFISLRCHQEVGSLRFSCRLLTTGNSSQSSNKNDDGDKGATEEPQQSEKVVVSTQSADNQGAEEDKNVRKAAAKAKLASLLSSQQKDTQHFQRSQPVVELSRPRYMFQQQQQQKLSEEQKELKEGFKSVADNQGAEEDKNVRKAAAKAKLASLLSSQQKDTQHFQRSQPVVELSRPRYMFQQQQQQKLSEEQKELKEGFKSVGQQFTEAIKSVSKEVGGGATTESELLKSLKKWKSGDDELGGSSSATNIKDLLSGMTTVKSATRPREQAGLSNQRNFLASQPMEITGLFDAEPLNIFPVPPSTSDAPTSLLPTWDALAARDLELSIARPPANQFQEFIQWTNQGKIWTFPIDNEVGLEEEKSVPFHEHIFTERYIASWCPRTGPVAHFMELVCVGLSKNPHVSIERKHQVLDWYRDYFEEKRSLLEELGAIPTDANQGAKSKEENTS